PRLPPTSPPFPSTPLFRSRLRRAAPWTRRPVASCAPHSAAGDAPNHVAFILYNAALFGVRQVDQARGFAWVASAHRLAPNASEADRKSTRLNSSHVSISYA